MGRAAGVRVGVGLTKAVEHAAHLGGNRLGRRKQHVRVDVALQRLAGAADGAAHHGTGFGQIHGPVQAQHLAVEVGHLGQPQTAAFGEDQAWNHRAVMAALQLRQHTAGVGQAELLECAVGQHAAPAVKHHHGLGTSLNLRVQVERHGVGVDGQDAVHQVGSAVHQAFDQTVVVRAAALHHVASQRPGAARETNQGHAAVQGFANTGDRIKHILQLVHVWHRQRRHSGFIPHHFFKLGAFALCEGQAQTHGVWNGQDVGEQNGRVQRIAVQRLQGDFGGVVHIGGQAHEAARLGAGGAVLGQIPACLAHQPNGGVVGGLTQAGFEEAVVLERFIHAPIVAGAQGFALGCHPRLTLKARSALPRPRWV